MKTSQSSTVPAKYGTFPEPGTIRFERILPGPPERIWKYLTDSDKKKLWLAAGDIEPRTGGKVELSFQHKNLSKEKDPVPEKYKDLEDTITFYGKVTEYDPPKKLSYTWPEEDNGQSEVTFELVALSDENVKLILTHRRLGDDTDILVGVGAGWHTHLNILEDRLTGKEPEGFWKVHMPLEDEYRERLVR